MAINYLMYSASYQKTLRRPMRERQAVVARYLGEDYSPPGTGQEIIPLIQQELHLGKGTSKRRIQGDLHLLRQVYKKYLSVNEEQREQIVAKAEESRTAKARNPVLHVIWCFAHDGIRTRDDVIRLHAENGKSPTPPLPPEPEAHAEIKQENLSPTAEENVDAEGKSTSHIQRPFDLLASSIQDIAEAGQRIYCLMENTREEISELEKRLTTSEKENRILKQKLGGCEQRLAEIEDALTADPAQLAAVQATAQRLKRDVVVGLPTHTVIGEYWKKPYAIIYRRTLRRFLGDKGTQPSERNHITDAIRQIVVNPFHNSLGTEVRCNKREEGLTFPGMEPGETYYYCHPDPWLRLVFVIRQEEERVHFVDAFRKTAIA